jgi:hypothetical protein
MSTGVKTHRITDPNDDTRFVDVDPYLVEGTPRAMARVDQTSSGHPLLGPNFNISSTTDTQAGRTDLSLTNDPADTSSPCSGQNFDGSSPVGICGFFSGKLRHDSRNSGGSLADATDGDSLIYGLLA